MMQAGIGRDILSWIEPLAFFVILYGVLKVFLERNWRRLTSTYAAAHRPNGERWRFNSVCVGSTIFQASMFVIVAEDGLYMKPRGPFFSPGVLIPWDRLSLTGGVRGNRNFAVETVRDAIIVNISGQAGDAVREYWMKKGGTSSNESTTPVM